MNHIFADTTRPIALQGLSHKGIVVEDDVWIGAGATLLDGVRVGAHAIIGAGAVVTRDVAPYSIMAGNPARCVRSRLTPTGACLTAFADRVRDQLPDLLRYYAAPGDGFFLNAPDAAPTTRALCDAVELAGMLGRLDALPPGIGAAIRRRQRPCVDYDVLTVGYALEVLGEAPAAPFDGADAITAHTEQWLAALPWADNPWGAGAEIDHLSTALYFNQTYFHASPQHGPLLAWLRAHQNPDTGLWGSGDGGDLHLPVNGFYRLSRGSFAQFGAALPRPEQIIDSVLRHAANGAYFGPARGNACDVLDIIHPLWLCAKQTDYRRAEGERWAEVQIARIADRWQDGRGFSFALERTDPPTLQGSEMWLAVLYYLCDYTGKADAPGYRPQGVHRPTP